MKRSARITLILTAAIAFTVSLGVTLALASGVVNDTASEISETAEATEVSETAVQEDQKVSDSATLVIESSAEGYDPDSSSPAVVLIADSDEVSARIYDADGEIELEFEKGSYEVSYISPVNADGSIYIVPDTLEVAVETTDSGAVLTMTTVETDDDEDEDAGTDFEQVVTESAEDTESLADGQTTVEAVYTLVDAEDVTEEMLEEVLAALEEAAALDSTEVDDTVIEIASQNVAAWTEVNEEEEDKEESEETQDETDEDEQDTSSTSADSTSDSSSGSSSSSSSKSSSDSSSSSSSSKSGSDSSSSSSSSKSSSSDSSDSSNSESSSSDSSSSCSHTYKSAVTKVSTCSSTGVRTYTCTKCGDTYTESIAIAEGVHTWVTLETVDIYVCECDEYFYSKDEHIEHFLSYSKSDEKYNHDTFTHGYGAYKECSGCGLTKWFGTGSGPY